MPAADQAKSTLAYKAFISYSHAADGKLAPALRTALERFAKPWYRLRAFRVFQDTTGLAVTPALWGAIQKGLESSEYFVLLASSAAAESEWVAREVAFWLDHRPPETLLIVLTDGTIAWDSASRPGRTTSTRSSPGYLATTPVISASGARSTRRAVMRVNAGGGPA